MKDRKKHRAGLRQHNREIKAHIHADCITLGSKQPKQSKGTLPKRGRWHGIDWVQWKKEQANP